MTLKMYIIRTKKLVKKKWCKKVLFKELKTSMEKIKKSKASMAIIRQGLRTFFWAIFATAIPLVCYLLAMPGRANILEKADNFGMLTPGIIISLATLSYFVFQAILAMFYRPANRLSDNELPKVTVIIPAYNEGKYVLNSIESILSSNYPAEKLEIIAVNDGSKDDTQDWINKACQNNPNKINAIVHPKNMGKKHALVTGIKAATGEIIVTVDSDSSVEKDAIANIVSAFNSPKVGAVAGSIRVSNLNEGAIPKMLEVAFCFGFEFMRVAQSAVHLVLCTPGAISAYRKSALLPLLDEWLVQTFWGVPASIGEDRAITSMLIRNNWQVNFQNNACAFTRMPTTYSVLCKMFIRWCRSDVRENIIMYKYLFTKAPFFSFRTFALWVNIIFASTSMIMPLFILPSLLWALILDPFTAGCFTLANVFIWSLLPAFIYARRYDAKGAIWAFVYGLYCIPFISWISVYSCITVRNSNWMTRTATTSASLPELKKRNKVKYKVAKLLKYIPFL